MKKFMCSEVVGRDQKGMTITCDIHVIACGRSLLGEEVHIQEGAPVSNLRTHFR